VHGLAKVAFEPLDDSVSRVTQGLVEAIQWQTSLCKLLYSVSCSELVSQSYCGSLDLSGSDHHITRLGRDHLTRSLRAPSPRYALCIWCSFAAIKGSAVDTTCKAHSSLCCIPVLVGIFSRKW